MPYFLQSRASSFWKETLGSKNCFLLARRAEYISSETIRALFVLSLCENRLLQDILSLSYFKFFVKAIERDSFNQGMRPYSFSFLCNVRRVIPSLRAASLLLPWTLSNVLMIAAFSTSSKGSSTCLFS